MKTLFIFLLMPLFLMAKIYDCFMFNHELDLLEIRLNEMAPYVDHFVLVECAETHQGKPKPLYFEANKDRFAPFKDKIIHVIVTDRVSTSDVWYREGWQRDQIQRGLKNCSRDDIIIISDMDEIIRGKDLDRIISHLPGNNIVGCQLDLFVNYLNGFVGQWNGPVLTTYNWMPPYHVYNPNQLRKMRNTVYNVPDAGWHFSSAGGVEASLIKMASTVHAGSYAAPRQHAEKVIASTQCIPVDSQFPQYVIDHLDSFVQKGFVKEDCTLTRSSVGIKVHQ